MTRPSDRPRGFDGPRWLLLGIKMKLNIGADSVEIEGFEPIDRKFDDEAHPLHHHELGTIQADSVEEMRASHVLEHFAFKEVASVLRNWITCLQPGGIIKISVPDYDKIQDARSQGDRFWRQYLLGSQRDEDDFHKSIYTREGLQEVMEMAGLVDVCPWQSENTDTACLPVSLNLQGSKPGHWVDREDVHVDDVDVKVAAIMSLPRYGANTARGAIEATLQPFSIPLMHYQGAYWSHGIQNAMEDLGGADWMLTLDYDTMCTPNMLNRLMAVLGRNPQIDAVTALQVKRNADTPLMTITGQTSTPTDGRPFQVDTAHFGMTLLRMECLKKLPRPWFWEVPRSNGCWRDHDDPRPDHPASVSRWVKMLWDDPEFREFAGSDGTDAHLDPDIFFWKIWAEAGFTVYVAPDVRIGHLEECVAEYDDEMKVVHRYPHTWREAHREKEPETDPEVAEVPVEAKV